LVTVALTEARIVSRRAGADIQDEGAVEAAIEVNAVSLYRERGTETFQALHVKATRQPGEASRR
jgi:hypothetical protein